MDVSVIIPTYNRAALVTEAVESVLGQTFQDFEVVVVDDGSTDDTSERLAQYRSKVLVLKTCHGGIAHARNAGIKAARGRYLAFLDSDDRYLPHKLELQVALMERFPDVGLVCSEFSAVGDGVDEEFHLKTYHSTAFRNGVSYDRYFDEAMPLEQAGIDCPPWSNRNVYLGRIFDRYLHALFVSTNTSMLRRSVIGEVGLQDESLPLFEEYDFMLRVAKRHRVAFVDVPTYVLRYHEGQVSTTRRPDGPAVLVEKQRQLLRVVERHGLHDHDYYRAHRKDVDVTLGGLHRALGIALMANPGNEAAARASFSQSRCYGKRVSLLWLMSFLPVVPRRVALKLHDLLR